MIIIANPLCPIDVSTVSALADRADHLRFTTHLREVRGLVRGADFNRRLVITAVRDVEELREILSIIDLDGVDDFVIMVGPQVADDSPLTALLDAKTPDRPGSAEG